MSNVMTPAKTVDETDPWSFELFGCFDDARLCIFTFLLPCYTIGRNAEFFEEDGAIVGLFYGLGMCALAPLLRWRIRQKKNLEGNMLADVVVHAFCPCCALIQENKELYGLHGSHIGEKLPIKQKIERK